MDKLEEKIGYHFHDRDLLTTALTHSSYANEKHGEAQSYERLEFLGDSILGLVTAEFLYTHEPCLPEGRMTRLRAELVCEVSLHKTALELGLGRYMRLGRGEEHTGGRERPSILADMVEAIIAAMYLDSGMDQARSFILERILHDVEFGDSHRSADYKTQLQELVQRRSNQVIRPFSLRCSSTAKPAARAAARPRRRPSRWPPARRWKHIGNERESIHRPGLRPALGLPPCLRVLQPAPHLRGE